MSESSNHSSSDSSTTSNGLSGAVPEHPSEAARNDVSEGSSVTSYEEDEDYFRIYDNTFDKIVGNINTIDLIISEEDLLSMRKNTTQLQDWKDVKLTSANVTIHVGETRDETWQQAVLEVITLRETFFKTEFDNQKLTLKQIAGLLFNKESALTELFLKKLDITYGQLCLFLASFFALVAYLVSATYNTHRFIAIPLHLLGSWLVPQIQTTW
jgi:hypothetical protein